MDTKALLAEIAAAQQRHRISDSAFGLAVLNDGHFIRNLKAGRRCWPETAKKVLDYIAKLNAIQTVRTQDGTVIAYDPISGTTATGRTLDGALSELRRLLGTQVAA